MPATLQIPPITVVMATYNRADKVKYSIDSILKQSFSNFEFIIVDDGSSDQTPEILREYSDCDKRIVIHCQKNQGLAAARNEGVRQAQGEYIVFMDDDDVSSPYRLERQYAFLKKHQDYSACTSMQAEVTSQGILLNVLPGKKIDALFNKGISSNEISFTPVSKGQMRVEGWVNIVLNSSSMITKESFVACGGYRKSDKIIEDLDFTFFFHQKLFSMAIISEYLYAYTMPHMGNDSLISQDIEKSIKRHIATYVSAWCRLYQQSDPVDKDWSLDEINRFIHKMPRWSRYGVYKSLKFLVKTFCVQKNVSEKEAYQHMQQITGLNKIDIILCQIRCEDNILTRTWHALKRTFARY